MRTFCTMRKFKVAPRTYKSVARSQCSGGLIGGGFHVGSMDACIPLTPAPPLHQWLQLVLFYLPVDDLFRCRRVSSDVLTLVSEHLRRMTHLNLSHLRGIRFSWQHFHLLTENNYCLRHLNVANAWWIDENAFANKILPRQSHLVSVDLSRSYSVTNITLQSLVHNCPLIEMLTLKYCNWLSQEVFLLLVDRFQHLHMIDVTSCWNLNDDCIRELFRKRGSSLRRVILASLYSLTDKATEAIQLYGTSLKYLDISSCWRITDSGVRNLTRNDSIEQIRMDSCSNITFVGRRALIDNGITIVSTSCP